MGVFDKASLALVPDGIKDGKLYSIKPTDGSGDFTFTRGTNLAATRVDENGLIEKGRENLLLQSNQFDTTWTTSTSASVSSGQTGYDGSSNAWLLSKTAANQYVQQQVTFKVINTFSVYIKAGASTWVALMRGDGQKAFFDLNGTGALGSVTSGITSKIEIVGNGWFRCSFTFENNTTNYTRIYPANGNGDISGTSGSIYIQDAQLEVGLAATDYIETGASTAQAGILEDLPRIDYTGSTPSLLLEPSRTNLVTKSEYYNASPWSRTRSTITDNAETSPEGVDNASALIATAVSDDHFISSQISVTDDVYTYSVFLKKGNRTWARLWETNTSVFVDFNLDTGATGTTNGTIIDKGTEDFGDGWYRCYFTYDTGSAGTKYYRVYAIEGDNDRSYLGDGTSEEIYIYGAQVELGSYATSYIPTYGTSVTRNGDFCTKTDATSLIGQTEGTMFIEIDENNTQDNRLFAITNGLTGNNTNYFVIQREGANALQIRYFKSGGSEQTLTTIAGFSVGRHKIGFGYKNGEFNVCVDGTSNLVTSTINMPVDFNTIVFSKHPLYSSVYYNAVIKQAAIFPTRLTDAELVALTTL